MILVFLFLLFIFILLDSLFIILLLSNIIITINELKLSNLKEYVTDDYIINISLNLFNKFKWFNLKLDNKKIKKIYSKIKTSKIDSRKVIDNIIRINHKSIKKLKPDIEKLDLLAGIGTEDAILTSSTVFLSSLFISTILPQLTKRIDEKNFKYRVIPVYNKNVYYIELNCIFAIKLVHIINIIYIYLKERKTW